MINGMMTVNTTPQLPEGTYMLTIVEEELFTRPIYGNATVGIRPPTFKGIKIKMLQAYSWVVAGVAMRKVIFALETAIPQKAIRIQFPTYNDTAVTVTDTEGKGSYSLNDTQNESSIIDTLVEAMKKDVGRTIPILIEAIE